MDHTADTRLAAMRAIGARLVEAVKARDRDECVLIATEGMGLVSAHRMPAVRDLALEQHVRMVTIGTTNDEGVSFGPPVEGTEWEQVALLAAQWARAAPMTVQGRYVGWKPGASGVPLYYFRLTAPQPGHLAMIAEGDILELESVADA